MTTKLFLQDELTNLDQLTELADDRIFMLQKEPLMSYEKSKDVQVDFTIEMNLSQKVIARSGYTALDWISDIGGMQGMLISFVAIFIAFWNHNMIENHLVSRLFKIKRVNEVQRPNESQGEFQGGDSTQYRYLKMMPRMA